MIVLCMQMHYETKNIYVFETKYLKYQQNIEEIAVLEYENAKGF